MTQQFFTIGILTLLSAMLPGPDFALVTKNTLFHSRRAGLFTALGIGSAIFIHISYCALGLAIIISKSVILFNLIKYVGAAYLFYLGLNLLLSKASLAPKSSLKNGQHAKSIGDVIAYRQGFMCNLLNPKASLFFLALFTAIIKPETSAGWEIVYAMEIFCILTGWFCSLTFFLSHPAVLGCLHRIEKYIAKTLGIIFISFGMALSLLKQ